jgi:hypothetical protein
MHGLHMGACMFVSMVHIGGITCTLSPGHTLATLYTLDSVFTKLS